MIDINIWNAEGRAYLELHGLWHPRTPLDERMCRELPIALAHCYAGQRLYAGERGQQRMDLLNRIFVQLDPVGQLRCRAELLECNAAKRGQRLAQVS